MRCMTAQLRVFAISRGFLFPGSNSHISNPFDHVQSIRRDLFDPRRIESRCTTCVQD